MRRLLSHCAFLLPVLGCALLAQAGQQVTTSVESENFSFSLPLDMPTTTEVLRALPASEMERVNPRVTCELVAYRVGDSRFFPLVGAARLVQVQFKCTVDSDAGREVVYINRDKLIRSK